MSSLSESSPPLPQSLQNDRCQIQGAAHPWFPSAAPSQLEALDAFRQVRSFSKQLTRNLQPEDCVIQSMPDVSPTRWHLAHTTWFFETFILRIACPTRKSHHPEFEYLFNSYYNSVGEQFPRAQRGLLSRPTLSEVWSYRQAIDEEIEQWLSFVDDEQWRPLAPVFQIGIQHEQQHQELMLTDILHVFSCNPLLPAVFPSNGDDTCYETAAMSPHSAKSMFKHCIEHPGGIVEIGHAGDHFAYDNESPRHRTLLEPFKLSTRPVTNGDFLQFLHEDGYQRSELWLSAGWATVQQFNWSAPLYWFLRDGQWHRFTLNGLQPIELDAPVCHVSYFEADAYARWADARLPTEAEWETVAQAAWLRPSAHGPFAEETTSDSRIEFPWRSSTDGNAEAIENASPHWMFGGVWEWTASPYIGYPGYQPPPGAIGEYNGKFMCNQYVLRGGSQATPRSHIRATYRNFFPPDARWQFSGLRLAH